MSSSFIDFDLFFPFFDEGMTVFIPAVNRSLKAP
jgi:hypothetical protein